jgi:hypothetical protein
MFTRFMISKAFRGFSRRAIRIFSRSVIGVPCVGIGNGTRCADRRQVAEKIRLLEGAWHAHSETFSQPNHQLIQISLSKELPGRQMPEHTKRAMDRLLADLERNGRRMQASAQLFQHIRALSPTSQLSSSAGAPTRGAEMLTRPST